MKTSQSVLPAATPKKCRETERIRAQIKAKLTELFQNGFWFCFSCQRQCERVEGEHGQPDHCDRCKSPRIRWNPPVWTEAIPVGDTQLLHPGEL